MVLGREHDILENLASGFFVIYMNKKADNQKTKNRDYP